MTFFPHFQGNRTVYIETRYLGKFCLKRYTLKKEDWKSKQLEKVLFIRVNEIELFSFFNFMCVSANACELFCMVILENIERFLYHSKLSF